MIVYLLTNEVNGKKYVGQTVQPWQNRWRHHCWKSTVLGTNMPIASAIAKYGRDAFAMSVLSTCSSQEELNRLELHWARKLNTFSPHGYNLRAGAGTGALSEETKKKISRANTGKRHSPETIQKLRDSHRGHPVAAETRSKLSAINKGKRGSDLCYERAAEANSKTFTLVSPTGKLVTFKNMARFCRDNDLNRFKLCEVAAGRAGSHKGWKLPSRAERPTLVEG